MLVHAGGARDSVLVLMLNGRRRQQMHNVNVSAADVMPCVRTCDDREANKIRGDNVSVEPAVHIHV